MLKLKLQYFGHLAQRTDSLEKTLALGKIEGRRTRQRMRWLDGITNCGHDFEQALGAGDGQAWHAAVHGAAKSQTRSTEPKQIKTVSINVPGALLKLLCKEVTTVSLQEKEYIPSYL